MEGKGNDGARPNLDTLGNVALLDAPLLSFFCSRRCPGSLIIKTHDVAGALRDAGVAVISGFHSPIEQECFTVLLRGRQPIVHCLARRLPRRPLPPDRARVVEEGRLLVVTPFGDNVPRATAATGQRRNDLVASLAREVFVAHAAAGSTTLTFCKRLIARGQTVTTFDDPANEALLRAGARAVISVEDFK